MTIGKIQKGLSLIRSSISTAKSSASTDVTICGKITKTNFERMKSKTGTSQTRVSLAAGFNERKRFKVPRGDLKKPTERRTTIKTIKVMISNVGDTE